MHPLRSGFPGWKSETQNGNDTMWVLIGRGVENEPVTYRITWNEGRLRFDPPDIRHRYFDTIRPGTMAPDPATNHPVPYDETLSWVAFWAARQTLWSLGARRMRVEGDGWQWPTSSRDAPP